MSCGVFVRNRFHSKVLRSARRRCRRSAPSRCFSSSLVPELTPLCERPADHVLSLKTFHEWRAERLQRLPRDSLSYGIPLSELKAVSREAAWGRVSPPCRVYSGGDLVLQEREDCRLRLSLEELEALWKQRLVDRVPIQYLTNTVHWRDVVLAVGPGVLIPRPETEQVIDLADSALQRNPRLLHLPWADLGTGSGAIAICLARLLKSRGGSGSVLAVDSSLACLKCARLNAERLELTDRIKLLQGSWFDPLESWRGELGGIISNPPYIPSSDLSSLQPEVIRHEPVLALDGGPEGLNALEQLTDNASAYLTSGGVLILETNAEKQPSVITGNLEDNSLEGFHQIRVHRDIYGKERFVVATKQ